MKICIHRGSREIGGSCVEIEHAGDRLIVDLGVPLEQDLSEASIPETLTHSISSSKPLGILISHSHLDHFGLLGKVSQDIPVGMGLAARRMINAAKPFLPGDWPTPASGWDFQSEVSFTIGSFTVTPFLVDHSAYDAYAFLIKAGGKRVFYSGDLRGHGRKASLFEKLVKNSPKSVDALLIEGSTIGRIDDDEKFPSESEIEERLVNEFRDTPGIVLVHASAQNIDRIVSVFRAAKRMNRKLVIDLYAAVILASTKNERIPQSDWESVALYVPESQRRVIKRNEWFDLLREHSKRRIFLESIRENPEQFVMLFRPLHAADLERERCLSGASYILSMWDGYWERGLGERLQPWLDRHVIDMKHIHGSGHACPKDLQRLARAMNPLRVVPIHSFRPDRYSELFERVEYHSDGTWWDV